MDGLLVVDKPEGPTSHDVVARVRRATGERRIGHTGTLDPAASGVLPLVLGRATRLARFLSGNDKSYDASIRLGLATDTYDAQGEAVGRPYDGPLPSVAEIEEALDGFRGTFLQQPPRYSAKKVNGRRSYQLARTAKRKHPGHPVLHAQSALPAPLQVTARAIELVGVAADTIALHVHCSAGFYVRSLAHDLGERLGVGAHLSALRRTSSGELTLADAVPLAALEREPESAARFLVPLSKMLSRLPALVLTAEGVRWALSGRDLDQGSGGLFASSAPEKTRELFFRLMDLQGKLIGIAEPSSAEGLLHPSVILV